MSLDCQNTSDDCRLCDENTEKMYNIFEKDDNGLQILLLIKECLPLIIYRTDPLSKRICQGCFEKLGTFYTFKKTSIATNDRHIKHLRENGDSGSAINKRIQLYLGCEDSEMEEVSEQVSRSVETCTEDLPLTCPSCKSTYEDINTYNEVELCADFHTTYHPDTLTINKVLAIDPDKTQRARRRRSQAFYHELDDSLCSSLTEYTNTESSQYPDECPSDVDSYDSDDEENEPKKRKLTHVETISTNLEEIFNEEEFIYNPLSLTALTLNIINKENIEGYEPDDFFIETIHPECAYCHETFKNSKLLALHEIQHINIELGEKVDSGRAWHESRDDADIRNRWLHCRYEGESELVDVENCDEEEENLLIPVGSEATEEEQNIVSDIVVEDGQTLVNGIPLTKYSKDERKTFYKTIKIGAVTRRFCPLCRYNFKDNWAVESHYLSLACHYTCRYCGMRFNKQRASFDEHVLAHERNGDALSTKIFTASKQNNVVPKLCVYDKARKSEAMVGESPKTPVPTRSKSSRRSQPLVKVKEEPIDYPTSSQNNKSPNQAYFCRKCYKVFFKLDEFNIHSRNCDYNQFPGGAKAGANDNSNGEILSPTGRPMRNCVKDFGTYKDEPDCPQETPQTSFICFICNTPFPTIYSRNSHMRVHKGESTASTSNHRFRDERNKREVPSRSRNLTNSAMAEVKVKKERLEPEVRIHESRSNHMAAVSITPISKNPNQKATINPNIMKLVQNNPHLSIKANMNQVPVPERSPSSSSGSLNNSDADKSYKCSNCGGAFNNKSHLYFHKKNQCEGSKYPCPFCKKRFGTEAAYSSHIFYSHPE